MLKSNDGWTNHGSFMCKFKNECFHVWQFWWLIKLVIPIDRIVSISQLTVCHLHTLLFIVIVIAQKYRQCLFNGRTYSLFNNLTQLYDDKTFIFPLNFRSLSVCVTLMCVRLCLFWNENNRMNNRCVIWQFFKTKRPHCNESETRKRNTERERKCEMALGYRNQ